MTNEANASGSDRTANVQALADAGFSLVVGVGFAFSPDINTIAPDYPDTSFMIVDGYATCGTACGLDNDDLANVADFVFKEQEGSFLVGAAAALKCECDTIGFLGGQTGPLIQKFEAGYTAGAKAVNPNIKVLVEYIGDDVGAFNDPIKGEALSTKMYDDGAEIIYHASGASGAGLFNAAVKADKLAIGVDSDQYLTASAEQQPLILTSMLKRVDVAVYNAIEQVGSGTFAAGATVFGMAEDGVDFSTVEHGRADAGHHRPARGVQGPDHRGRHRRPRGPDQGLIRKADERMTNEHGAGRGSAPPLVVLEHITKRFPGVLANDDVSLELRPAEVHALIGENGAGKSTLMRVLYGMYPADGGTITVRGQEVKIASPRDAIALGIGMVHQHFVLVDPFTVTENIILGNEGRAVLDTADAERRVSELADTYGFHVQPDAVIEELSVGEEQRVEILKALYRGVEILILDEPTAVLTPIETQDLFGNLRNLRDAGKTIVFISHKLDEVMQIADRITVLRRGAVVGETTPAETSKAKLAEMMVGRPVLFRLEKPQVEIGAPVLHVDGLEGSGKLHGLSFDVRAGEILGVAGVEGNGQRELAETLIGLRTPDAGEILLDQTSIAGWSVKDVRNAGVGYIPEDRHEQGLVLDMTIWENVGPGTPRRRGVLEPHRRPVHQEGEGAGRQAGEAVRRAHAEHRRHRQHVVRREPAEADPGARAGDGSQAADRGPAHARARRRRDRVRLVADPGAEGGGARGPVDLRRARRDLRAVRSDRDALRGADHGRVRARRRAGGHRGRHARRRRARGDRLMATTEVAAPIAEPKIRSEWLERLVGQPLALLGSLAIALALGALLIIAYGESPVDVYGAILRFSFGSLDGFGYVLAIATPLIFSALAVAVCFKGGMFNIGVEGQYLVGMVTAAWAATTLTSSPARSTWW